MSIVLICTLMLNIVTEATVIYVSSSTGDDRNVGNVSSLPVSTLARASSLAAQISDDSVTVLLARNDIWINEHVSVIASTS